MRFLLLSLNIVVGVSLATLPAFVSAATLSKSTQHKAKKSDKTQAKNRIATGSSDLWERIRAGMKIPHPVASQTVVPTPKPIDSELSSLAADFKPDNAVADETLANTPATPESNLKIRPIKARPPVNQYTELGQKLLGGSKMPKAKIIDCSVPKPVALRPLNATRNKAEIAQINERIKASMEASATARKHTVILVGSRSTANSDLASNSASADTPEPMQVAELPKPVKLTNPCAAHPELQQGSVQANVAAENSKAGLSTKPVNTQQVVIDERINKFITGYSQNPGFLYSVAQRAQPYLFHIVESLSKHGMPMELALLPIVESAYQPTAQSPKNAAGLWQFIPMTGKDFNLEQSKEYDERLDIPESTQAAIRFLSGLKDHFKGDWLLALAAYNSGQGTVDKAISLNQSQGLPTDFWSLRLPEETQNYVPRLLALARIFAHPGAYGVKLAPIKNEPFFVEVKLGREFDVNYLTQKAIDSVAQLASLTPEQFSSLNPDYLNNTLPKQESYSFLMPERNAKLLKERLISIEKFISAPVVADGESNKSLALNAESKNILFPGSTLSVLSDLVNHKSTGGATMFPTPMLSLNVDAGKIDPFIDFTKL
jgi:soluble lytic murein transglycosylase-like protein